MRAGFDRTARLRRRAEPQIVERGTGEEPESVRVEHERQARVARLEASRAGREFLARVERIGRRS